MVAQPTAIRPNRQDEQVVRQNNVHQAGPIQRFREQVAQHRTTQVGVELFEQGGIQQNHVDDRWLRSQNLLVEIFVQVHAAGARHAHVIRDAAGKTRQLQSRDPAFAFLGQFTSGFFRDIHMIVLRQEGLNLLGAEGQF